ncbi:MAG: hypothetical protein Q9227_003935 [Pyrenula ochraceoflavens]
MANSSTNFAHLQALSQRLLAQTEEDSCGRAARATATAPLPPEPSTENPAPSARPAESSSLGATSAEFAAVAPQSTRKRARSVQSDAEVVKIGDVGKKYLPSEKRLRSSQHPSGLHSTVDPPKLLASPAITATQHPPVHRATPPSRNLYPHGSFGPVHPTTLFSQRPAWGLASGMLNLAGPIPSQYPREAAPFAQRHSHHQSPYLLPPIRGHHSHLIQPTFASSYSYPPFAEQWPLSYPYQGPLTAQYHEIYPSARSLTRPFQLHPPHDLFHQPMSTSMAPRPTAQVQVPSTTPAGDARGAQERFDRAEPRTFSELPRTPPASTRKPLDGPFQTPKTPLHKTQIPERDLDVSPLAGKDGSSMRRPELRRNLYQIQTPREPTPLTVDRLGPGALSPRLPSKEWIMIDADQNIQDVEAPLRSETSDASSAVRTHPGRRLCLGCVLRLVEVPFDQNDTSLTSRLCSSCKYNTERKLCIQVPQPLQSMAAELEKLASMITNLDHDGPSQTDVFMNLQSLGARFKTNCSLLSQETLQASDILPSNENSGPNRIRTQIVVSVSSLGLYGKDKGAGLRLTLSNWSCSPAFYQYYTTQIEGQMRPDYTKDSDLPVVLYEAIAILNDESVQHYHLGGNLLRLVQAQSQSQQPHEIVFVVRVVHEGRESRAPWASTDQDWIQTTDNFVPCYRAVRLLAWMRDQYAMLLEDLGSVDAVSLDRQVVEGGKRDRRRNFERGSQSARTWVELFNHSLRNSQAYLKAFQKAG